MFWVSVLIASGPALVGVLFAIMMEREFQAYKETLEK